MNERESFSLSLFLFFLSCLVFELDNNGTQYELTVAADETTLAFGVALLQRQNLLNSTKTFLQKGWKCGVRAQQDSFLKEELIHPCLKGRELCEALASGMNFNPTGPGEDPNWHHNCVLTMAEPDK